MTSTSKRERLLLPAGILTAGLLLAVAEALGLPGGHAAALAFAGTLAVYNVDRLRDVERDERAAQRSSVGLADEQVTPHAVGLEPLFLLVEGDVADRVQPHFVGIRDCRGRRRS